MSDIHNILLILNPHAGKSNKRLTAEQIVSIFPKDSYRFTVKQTQYSGHATELVKEFAQGHDLVVCAGGDGTLNETINGVMSMANRIPVGYIPMGSTNDFATTLGIPSEPKKAVDIILSGHKNWYDIGLFNNRYFQYVASFGAFTNVSYETSQKLKNYIGHAAYVLNAISQWSTLKPVHMKIEFDDTIIEDDIYFGAISNCTSVAGMFRFDKDTVRLDDGTFEILLVRRLKNWMEAPKLLSKIRKKDYDGKQIIFAHANNVKLISTQGVKWTLDGEYGGENKQVVISNLCRSIKICSPVNPLFQSVNDEEGTEKEKPKYDSVKKSK